MNSGSRRCSAGRRLGSLWLATAILAASCGGAAVAPSSGPDTVTQPLPRGPNPSHATQEEPVKLGPTDPASEIHFTLVLAFPGQAEMDRYVSDLQDPTSRNFHHYLAAAQIGDRFGLPESAIDRAERWVVEGGLRVTDRHPQRTTLGVSGSAARIRELLGVTLLDYREPGGRVYRVVEGDPLIPEDLRDVVLGVTGLDTRDVFRPRLRPPLAAVRPGGLLPADIARAYDIESLHASGINGEGQTIAIVSFDTFLDSDIATYDQATGIQGPPVQRVPVAGGVDTVGDDANEVNLDLDIVRAIAPKAQILNLEAPNTGSFGPVVNAAVADPRVDIVSISYGRCEVNVPDLARVDSDRAFQAAVARGMSIFIASGDSGAYSCRHQDQKDIQLSADYPTVNPNVIGVGGTYLTTREDGSYFEEAGWEEPLGAGGAGGGVSINYERPAWQTGPGVDNSDSNGKRQTPDVAGPADCDSAFFVVWTLPKEEQFQGPGGCGTSASSPFFAASMLLIRQLAEREGVGRLGFVAPMLYELAASNPPNTIFNDIIRGGNLLNNAGPGWDYATGLGTPRVAALGRAVVEYLRAHGGGGG